MLHNVMLTYRDHFLKDNDAEIMLTMPVLQQEQQYPIATLDKSSYLSVDFGIHPMFIIS